MSEEYRRILNERREALREHYARYRKYGSIMCQKGLVQWSNKSHGYTTEFLWDRSYKTRTLIKKLLELQRNVHDQALLILELEHAIDREEQKGKDEAKDKHEAENSLIIAG
jgi:hypothetical protein